MFDLETMFELGYAFMNGGETIFHEGAIKNRSKYQNVAGVVNLAFACELFLKCLLNLEGSTTSGDKLRDLWSVYNRISPDDALVIKNAVMHSMVADFETATLAFDNELTDSGYDVEHSITEDRDWLVGCVFNHFIFVVYTMRGDVIRLINARLATKGEIRRNFERNA